MTKRFGLASLFASMLLVGAAYLCAFAKLNSIAPWLMAIGASGSMVAVLIMGAARGGRVTSKLLQATFTLTFLVLAGGFVVALRAPNPDAQAQLFFGLPAGAATVLYIVGIVPMLVLPIVYALTFDEKQ